MPPNSSFRAIAPLASTLAFAFAVAWSMHCPAQTSLGAVRGSVTDQTGRRITSASARFTSSAAAPARKIHVDSHGEFDLRDLRPGEYSVRITAPGFASAQASVRINVASTRELDTVLKPETQAQTIAVRANPSSITAQPLDTTGSTQQNIITRSDLDSLPLAARSFSNIAYLAPGTEPVEPSDPTKARITAVSTGGSSGLNNDLTLDGADDTDDYIGGFLQNFSPDAIEEFSVRTSQQDADSGNSTGGSIVISTRSGTDIWHGSAALYERAAALNARSPLDPPAPAPKQNFSRQDGVATLSGPLRPERLWFFNAFEFVHEDAGIAQTPANFAQLNDLAALAAAGLIPGVPNIPVPRSVPVVFRDFNDDLRFDWSESEQTQSFLRAAVDTYTTHNDLVQQGTLASTGLLTHNNYLSLVASQQHTFSPTLVGRLLLGAGGLHLTQTRNSNLGFALAFPFSATSRTTSGFETFGDNQFSTPITYFPQRRDQQKYQLRYDLNKTLPSHVLLFGINFIHEPVLNGAFPSNPETLYQLPENPSYYLAHPSELPSDFSAGSSVVPAGGSFAQNVQRLGLYAQDAWNIHPSLTLNLGLRYSTTFGLLNAFGRTQLENPGYITLHALGISLVSGAPRDDHQQFAPRLGFAWSPQALPRTVLRGGFGIFYDDLAQTGWATALESLQTPPSPCTDPLAATHAPGNTGCIPGSSSGGTANLIDPNYHTPYALHITAGVEHALNNAWTASASYVHEQGNHGYRAYSYQGGANLFTPLLPTGDPSQADVVPDLNLFRSDNRSSYNALLVRLQGNRGASLHFVANYTFSKAQTWGCVLGELFDYVNGVCDPLHAFAPGDYGPSGEDVRNRAVLAGTWRIPAGIELSGISQLESARPFTITTADGTNRISINGLRIPLDAFRGTPYLQTDLRISRTINLGERWRITPLAEFFNLFNRANYGANYVTDIASLPVPTAQAQSGNVSSLCTDASCTSTSPIRDLNQLAQPAGLLGDFFGPGTTVGEPFATQLAVKIAF